MSDATPGVPPSAPSDKTAMLILSYLGLLALVPLLVEKEDKNVQWHAKNGLVIFAAFIVASIALWILTMVVSAIPALGCLVAILTGLAHLALFIGYLVVIVMGIMKALKGERLILPIYQICRKQPVAAECTVSASHFRQRTIQNRQSRRSLRFADTRAVGWSAR